MGWIPRMLRGNTVFANSDENGALCIDDDGRVAIRYQDKDDAKVYRANPRNLHDPKGKGDAKASKPQQRSRTGAATKSPTAGTSVPRNGSSGNVRIAALPDVPSQVVGTIDVWTDGACTGNPGPAGLGVVVIKSGRRHELSEFLGNATNNIAELSAIGRALEVLWPEAKETPIRIFTDSSYSIGVLAKGFRAKANRQLIAGILDRLGGFSDVMFVKVPGHAGVPDNELADELARRAITERH